MQRSIDSFFKRSAKKEPESPVATIKKRKALVISSDEDEVVPATPENVKHKKPRTEEEPKSRSGNTKKTPSLSKLKPAASAIAPKKELQRVDPMALFGGETLRVEAPKRKPKEMLELEDEDINQSLLDLDVDASLLKVKESEKKSSGQNGEAKEKAEQLTPSSAKKPKQEREEIQVQEEEKKKPKEEKKNEQEKSEKSKEQTNKSKAENKEEVKQKKEKLETLMPNEEKKKEQRNVPETSKAQMTKPKAENKEEVKAKEKLETPKADKNKGKSTPRAKKEPTDLDGSVLTDEERHERRRMTAAMYQKYKNRSACINPGSKEVPKGKPNCLAGLTFLVTGVLESLERDEASSIIKEYGGKVMTVVGKRLNYLIVGEEAGLKKLAQAEEFNTKVLSEDEFLDLIRVKSGQKPKMNEAAKTDEENPSTSPKNKSKEQEIKIKKEKSPTPPKKHVVKKEKEEHNNHNVKVEDEKVKAETKPELKTEDKPMVKTEDKPVVKTEVKPVVKAEVDESMLPWVEKYKPTSVKDIIGQHGAASNVVKLTNWLSKWYINHDGKKKPQRPNPWAKNDDGSFYKAALLSGPPGIGKTTTATLVVQELGFDAVEFNASDTRSKRLLKEEVSELISNKSLYGFCHGQAQAVTKKHVLIMDEVDGMAGNEDRGGIQELIALIKDSSVPIICMCNDRNHQKMRSLVNHCYDLRFNKPRLEQIKGRILSICCREKIKLPPARIEEIIAATNNDIRQSINHISLLSAGKDLNLKSDSAEGGAKTAQKDMKIGPWDVVRKVFSAEEHKHMTLNDKCSLFFHDYSLAPLFVQQNYLQVSPAGPKSEVMRKIASTADALSLGDLVDKRIRSSMAWSLLPTQAVFSSVLPGEYMSGHFTGQINFPGWLGKNSRSSKRSRLAQELHDHTRLRTSASRLSIRSDYAPILLANIVRPLREQGMEGIEGSLAVLKEYHLLREDIDALIDLTTWPGKKGPMDAVDGRVKAALTRAYNKEVLAYSYSAAAGVKKKRADADADEVAELLEGEEGEENVVVESDEEKDDDLENDGLIKAKKKPAAASTKATTSKAKATAAPKKPAASKAKPSTSKAKK